MADAWRQSLLLVVAALLAWRSQATLAPMMWFGETPSGRLMVVEDGITTAWSPLAQGPSARLALGLPVLVNRASAEELEQVPGIGPRTATKIVRSRSDDGCFDRHSALMRVRGIGPKTVSKLAPYLGFGGTRPPACDVIRHG